MDFPIIFSTRLKNLITFLSGRPLAVVAFIFAGSVIYGRIENLEIFAVNVWGDRDLWRGLEAYINWEGHGPETSSGFRPFGGFFYLLINFIFSLWADVKAANLAVSIFFFLSVAPIASFLWGEVSPRAAAIAALTMTGCAMPRSVLMVWNPGFIILFSSGFIVFTYLFIRTGKPLHLGLAFLFAFLGAQIHFQILILVMALPLAMIVYRIRPMASHGIAIVGALLVAYLPSILADPSAFFTLSSSPSNGDFSGNLKYYLYFNLADFITNVSLTAVNFFNASGGSANGLQYVLPMKYVRLVWVVDILAAALAAWAFIVFVFRWRKGARDDYQKFGVFGIFAGVYFIVLVFTDQMEWHFVSIIPVLAVLTAIGAENILNRREKDFPIIFSMATILLVALFCSRSWLVSKRLPPMESNIISYLYQEEIANNVKSKYYPDHRTFEERSSIFISDGKKLTYSEPTIYNTMATVFRMAQPDNIIKTPMDACLLIVSKERIHEMELSNVLLLARESLAGLMAVIHGDQASETASLYFFPYSTPDANCLKNFSNAYIATPFEQRFLQSGAYGHFEKVVPLDISSDRAGFAIPVADELFPMAVEFVQADDRLTATVHGRLMRGFTGLDVQILSDVTLHFVSDVPSNSVTEQKSININFGKTRIGDKSLGTLTPWHSESFFLPHGKYQVLVTANILLSEPKGMKSMKRDLLGMLSLSPDGVKTF